MHISTPHHKFYSADFRYFSLKIVMLKVYSVEFLNYCPEPSYGYFKL